MRHASNYIITGAGRAGSTQHLKDLRAGTKKDLPGGTSQENNVPPGTIEINIAGILKEAKKIGIKHYFINDESVQVSQQVPQSTAYLKGLKGLGGKCNLMHPLLTTIP